MAWVLGAFIGGYFFQKLFGSEDKKPEEPKLEDSKSPEAKVVPASVYVPIPNRTVLAPVLEDKAPLVPVAAPPPAPTPIVTPPVIQPEPAPGVLGLPVQPGPLQPPTPQPAPAKLP